MKTYTAMEAFNMAAKETTIKLGENLHHFTLIGWKSEEGTVSGPFLVIALGGQIIELDRHGKFYDSYDGMADGYFPWLELE